MVAQPKPIERMTYGHEPAEIRRKPINRGAYEWGRYLTNLRANRLLSQRRFAALAGVSFSTMCCIELGLNQCKPHTLKKLRTALKMDDLPVEAFLPAKWVEDVVVD